MSDIATDKRMYKFNHILDMMDELHGIRQRIINISRDDEMIMIALVKLGLHSSLADCSNKLHALSCAVATEDLGLIGINKTDYDEGKYEFSVVCTVDGIKFIRDGKYKIISNDEVNLLLQECVQHSDPELVVINGRNYCEIIFWDIGKAYYCDLEKLTWNCFDKEQLKK